MSKVEDYFITPMEAYFEAIPKDGPRETIISDLEQYASDDLMEAAEWLKRARQAQSTFPSPKECIKAIKAVVGGRRELPVIRGTVIDGTNYAANAHAYIVARGIRPGQEDVPVIRKGSEQWIEWTDYFHSLGVHWALELMDGRDTWTVPTEYPGQFDSRFVPVKRQTPRAA